MLKQIITKPIFIVSFFAIVLIAAIFLAQQSPSSNNPHTPTISQEVAVVTDNDNIKGAQDSQVVLIEYADFQCPACAGYFPIIKDLQSQFGEEVKFVYRHMPLKTIHKHAEIAAIASEASANQEKFWEMHDILLSRQDEWSSQNDPKEKFMEYAAELGMDTGKFSADLNSEELKQKVKSQYETAIQAGINSTPTFFLNGERLNNPQANEFTQIIQQKLEETKS